LAKLYELVEPGKLCYLRHPQYSYHNINKDGVTEEKLNYLKITWDGCWLYVYDISDNPLFVGNLTLFDDQWELYDSPWKKSKIYEEAQQIKEKEIKEMVDETQLRNMENWSYLSGKVVGAENE
jgi:hypothetical protein